MSARQFTKLDIIVLALIVVAGLIHLPHPFDGDQTVFTIGAMKISKGALLYRDFWDMKPPGIFVFYLLAGRLFGFTEVGIHTLELLYMTTFAAVLLITLKGYFESRAIASLVPLLTVGVYYGLTGSWHLTQIESLVGFPLFLTIWFASLPSRPKDRTAVWLFLSGVMGGVVLLFKFIFLPLVLSFWLAAVLDAVLRKGERIPKALLRMGVPILIGLLLPLLIVFSYFASQGALDLVRYAFFEYPARAVAELPGRRIGHLPRSLLWFLKSFTPLTALCFVWAYSALSKRRGWREMNLVFINLVLWVVIGLGVIIVQRLSWWDYHYMLLFVPLGILAAQGLDQLWKRVKEAQPSLAAGTGLVAVALALALLFSPFLASLAQKSLYLTYFGFARRREQRLLYQSEVNSDYKIALSETEFLAQPESLPGGIFVGGNPLYYYLSGREQAIPTEGWMLEYLLPEQWQQLREQLSAASPPYIFMETSFLKLLPDRSPETVHFIEERYRVLRTSGAGNWYVLQDQFQRHPARQSEVIPLNEGRWRLATTITHRSIQSRYQSADFISQPEALGFRDLPFNDRLSTGREVIAQYVALYAPESGNTSADLMSDINAVALPFDHLLQTAHLPFDALQAGHLSGVVNGHTAVCLLRATHFSSLPPSRYGGSVRTVFHQSAVEIPSEQVAECRSTSPPPIYNLLTLLS